METYVFVFSSPLHRNAKIESKLIRVALYLVFILQSFDTQQQLSLHDCCWLLSNLNKLKGNRTSQSIWQNVYVLLQPLHLRLYRK